MLLSDGLLILDLKQKCEDDLVNKLEEDNFFEVLLKFYDSKIEAKNLEFKLKQMFFKYFYKIKKTKPDLETLIYNRHGLMTALFEHMSVKKRITRRVTFVDIDDLNQ